jgi:3,4-dihydroxy 2-butanone 4-phosphate synthase/GTP cyclohydrolase II
MAFSTIPELLEELRGGRPIVLVDDRDPENGGDFCFPAEFVTPELVNMARLGGGLVCLAMDGATCDRLGLEPQVHSSTAPRRSHFTVSIEAREGITDGISAVDRAHTIRTAVAPDAEPADLVKPGHVFPLRARDGGVLVRAGHTEGIVDLCRLAGLRPVGVITEIMDEDGALARLPQLESFANERGLKIGAIADLVEYRRREERIVERVAAVHMPTRFGEFEAITYESKVDRSAHVALCVGLDRPEDPHAPFPAIDEPVLVRVHSQCLTGDVFGSMRCDCGEQLEQAMNAVQQAGRGVILYISQEGRGIGLVAKMKAYELQEQGLDTVEANVRLGFKPDEREFGTGAQILHDLGVRRLRVLTNNPRKLGGLQGYGLEIVEQVPIRIVPNRHNERYLATKRAKLGHLLDPTPGGDQSAAS